MAGESIVAELPTFCPDRCDELERRLGYSDPIFKAHLRQLDAGISKSEAATQFILPSELAEWLKRRQPFGPRLIDGGRAYCAVCCKPNDLVYKVQAFDVCEDCILAARSTHSGEGKQP